jgi:hypothetical protein
MMIMHDVSNIPPPPEFTMRHTPKDGEPRELTFMRFEVIRENDPERDEIRIDIDDDGKPDETIQFATFGGKVLRGREPGLVEIFDFDGALVASHEL